MQTLISKLRERSKLLFVGFLGLLGFLPLVSHAEIDTAGIVTAITGAGVSIETVGAAIIGVIVVMAVIFMLISLLRGGAR